jgi:hypothetical protein
MSASPSSPAQAPLSGGLSSFQKLVGPEESELTKWRRLFNEYATVEKEGVK